MIVSLSYFFSKSIVIPGPNAKSISVPGKSKSMSYLGFQYRASLNTSLTSLPSLNQDLDNTWKLIPKSKPTFQKNSSEIFEFKKISQRATILALLFGHFPGVLENDAGAYQIDYWVILAPREGLLRVFQVFWAVFSHFSAVWSRILAENQHIYFRS